MLSLISHRGAVKTWLMPWTAPALIAAALVLSVVIYVTVRWQRSPAAFRFIGSRLGFSPSSEEWTRTLGFGTMAAVALLKTAGSR